MDLTRRDAILALVASGAVVGGVGAAIERTRNDRSDDNEFDDELLPHLVAVAEVVYPSAVTPTTEFVRTYTLGRTSDRPEYRRGLETATRDLVEESQRRYGAKPAALPVPKRDQLLRTLGVATTVPDPDGTVPGRIRYYVVEELLYALYTTPVGGKLVGHENPDGHPGGLDAYQRGPK